MANKPTTHYENNPFFIGLNGLKLFFTNAQSVAIYAVVLTVLLIVVNAVSGVIDSFNSLNMTEAQIKADDAESVRAFNDFFAQDAGRLAVSGILIASVIFIVVLIWLFMYGLLEYAGARVALGEKVTLGKAIKAVGVDLAGYIWLYIIVGVKIFLWSLLLIVPGVIMAVRYSLAGTVFFAEGKRGNAAVKRSLELTKGAWFTTFAGFGLWNLITFNQITQVIMPGAAAILYRQFRETTDSKHDKPAAHWLSWLTFFVPIGLFVLFIGFLLLIVLIAVVAGQAAAP